MATAKDKHGRTHEVGKDAQKKNGASNHVAGQLNAPSVATPEIVVFKVTGASPLLQNNPAELIGKDETGGGLTKKKEYNDEEEAAMRTYKNDDGEYCHPSEAFVRAMVQGCKGLKFGKQHATTLIMSSVFATETLSVIETKQGKPAKKYDIDRRSVVVNKSRILRCRPVWHEWQIRVALEINTAVMSAEQALEALQMAGYKVGIGDYRPENGGRFGRFTVVIL